MVKYTFLLPAYKNEYLEIALSSILAQSYKDFCVIVSDDCSPNNLEQIVSRFHDSRIRYRRNLSNIGAEKLVQHWNLLLQMVDTDYCIMASDDDIYDSDFLKEIDSLTVKYPRVDVFRSRIRCINQNGAVFRTEQGFNEFYDMSSFASLWVRREISAGVPFYVFRTRSLLKLGGFIDFPYAWFSDDATVLSVAKGNGIAITKQVLFSFRFSGKNISTSTSPRMCLGKYRASVSFYEFSRYYIKQKNDREILARFIKYICHQYLKGTSNSFYRYLILIDMMLNPTLFLIPWVKERINRLKYLSE